MRQSACIRQDPYGRNSQLLWQPRLLRLRTLGARKQILQQRDRSPESKHDDLCDYRTRSSPEIRLSVQTLVFTRI